MAGTLTNAWSGGQTRLPATYRSGFPPVTPLAVAVANTAGQWLFAVVSWRQDAGTAGTLQYASSVSVADDAHNFWFPVRTVPANNGIVRCAIWAAPAARAAQYVFVSPTDYQSAMTVSVMEFTADCPWYTIDVCGSAVTNQGTSVTLSETLPTGSFALGVIAFDNLAAGSISITTSGWSSRTTESVTNGTDHNGDLEQVAVFLAGSGGSATISGSSAGNQDWADLIITVHGVTDTLAFPYATPLENWPTLVTEIASGPVLNSNPLFLTGTTNWTATNGAVAAVSWPVWNPFPYYQTLITQSLSFTPGGSNTTGSANSELDAVLPSVQYNATAYVYSVAGFSSCQARINWYTSGSGFISNSTGTATAVPAGEWTLLTFTGGPVFPPATAAFGQVEVVMTSGSNIPSSAVLYIGYCGFGPADAYEGTLPDEVQWTDFSSRNFTEQAISVSRGIQYEQQSLEAGTMTVTLANNDYAIMYGNTESVYWPTIGDTDVPIRLRAIWVGSITPYYVLFSGFTDDIDFGYNSDTKYAYAAITCSDVWSRLTQQLTGAAEEDVQLDNPVGYWPCNVSGANLALNAVTVLTQTNGPQGAGTQTASFSGNGIQLAGDAGTACWQSTSPGTSLGSAATGVALTYFPQGGANVLPPVSAGVTIEFWWSATEPTGSQPAAVLTVCTCWAGNGPMWTITVDNTGGSAGSKASVTVYDKATGAATTTSLGSGLYLTANAATGNTYVGVTFTQASLTVVVDPGSNTNYATVTTVACNLAAAMAGFSWGGMAGPLIAGNIGSTYGFMAIAVYGVALYNQVLPPARMTSHYNTAATGFPEEVDTSRLARIAGYSGFTPVLGMRGTDLNSSELVLEPALNVAAPSDLDAVTGATDTSGQVTSDYFTNIAQSTLAFLFTDGPGTLMYRRRLETANRSIGQWAVGEQVAAAINANTLNQGPSVAGWTGQNGATLQSSGVSVTPLFFPFCGLFHGDGSTANPQISFGSLSASPVTAGQWYQFSVWAYSPQGYASGLSAQLIFKNSGGSTLTTNSSGSIPLAVAGLTYIQTLVSQAPTTAAWAQLIIQAAATPASNVQFYVADAVLASVNTVTAGGNGATAPEASYLVDVQMSSDRAQLFNQATLTQYGTNTQESFRGTEVQFTPSSGVVVNVVNQASINQRGAVPYTATLYLDNTAQALPYMPNDPAMEDFANWIVLTLGSPLFRPLNVAITPAATPQSLLTALQAEVGDTVTFRRRHLSVPVVQILTYMSKLQHNIDIESGTWTTTYELSPFPQGNALQCDAVIQGCLTGGNVLTW